MSEQGASEQGASPEALVPPAPPAIVEHREILRSAILRVEDALATPSFGRCGAWCGQVAQVVRGLEEAFADHVHLTEEPDGLYEQLLSLAPRLERRVKALGNDHVEIMSRLSGFLNGLDASNENVGSADEERVDAWRVEGTNILGLLVRHRQRGIDLTYEAYRVDLGGE